MTNWTEQVEIGIYYWRDTDKDSKGGGWRKSYYFSHHDYGKMGEWEPDTLEESVVEYTVCDQNGNHDWIEEYDIPCMNERRETEEEYFKWVVESDHDPLGELFIRDEHMVLTTEVWHCRVSVNGSVMNPEALMLHKRTVGYGTERSDVVEGAWGWIKYNQKDPAYRHGQIFGSFTDMDEVRGYFITEGITLEDVDKHVMPGSVTDDGAGQRFAVLTSLPDVDAFVTKTPAAGAIAMAARDTLNNWNAIT